MIRKSGWKKHRRFSTVSCYCSTSCRARCSGSSQSFTLKKKGPRDSPTNVWWDSVYKLILVACGLHDTVCGDVFAKFANGTPTKIFITVCSLSTSRQPTSRFPEKLEFFKSPKATVRGNVSFCFVDVVSKSEAFANLWDFASKKLSIYIDSSSLQQTDHLTGLPFHPQAQTEHERAAQRGLLRHERAQPGPLRSLLAPLQLHRVDALQQ